MLLQEILPNPAGRDTEGEWIKLFNNEAVGIDLSGWQLKDASGKTYTFSIESKKIGPDEYLVLDYKTTKISLNNNGETLFLYNRKGELIDKAAYTGAAPEGKVLTRKGGDFIFTNDNSKKESLYVDANNALVHNNETEFPVIVNHKLYGDYLLVGFGNALFLAIATVLILKKLNLSLPEK